MLKNLYELASINAQLLMRLADIERFAVDDCILLSNSRRFQGWLPNEIKTNVLGTPLPIPDDLKRLREETLPAIAKNFVNSSHYRLASFTLSFYNVDQMEVTLAPVGFYEYYALPLDEPLLTASDGSAISIRNKYGYSLINQGACLIPAPISIQCIVHTADRQIILMRRSLSVAFYPHHWSASFEETMNSPGQDNKGQPSRSDADFFAGALRGLEEEFAVPPDAVESIKILSLNVEYQTLSIDIITLINLRLTSEEIRQKWIIEACDRDEASKFALLPADLSAVLEKLRETFLWHPTSRMRLLQFLFHTYGVKEVVSAFKI